MQFIQILIFCSESYSWYEIEEGTEREEDLTNPLRCRARRDPVLTRAPQRPTDPESTLAGVLMPTVKRTADGSIIRDTTRDEDPREALLKHAKDAEGLSTFLLSIALQGTHLI